MLLWFFVGIILHFYAYVYCIYFIFAVEEKEFCGELLLISDFVLAIFLLFKFEIRYIGTITLLNNGFNLLIDLAHLVKFNCAISIKILAKIWMLFHKFDFAFIILFDNLNLSFLEFDILYGLLLLGYIFDPLGWIVLL